MAPVRTLVALMRNSDSLAFFKEYKPSYPWNRGAAVLFNLRHSEDGQAAVEFAIVAVVLVLLIGAPIDLYRYAAAKTTLSNATSEALSQVEASELDDTAQLSAHALKSAKSMYGDRISNLAVSSASVSPAGQKVAYSYRVYSSDLANAADQFEARPSNYTYRTVELSLSCDWSATTFLGTLFLGSGTIQIASDPITRDVYVRGYEK